MLRRDILFAYVLQIAACFVMVFALLLPWHPEYGTGFQQLGKALETVIRIGLPFEYREVPISQWWIPWIPFIVGIGITLRAFNGIMFNRLRGQVVLVSLLVLMLCIGFGWYIANFYAVVGIGFWLCLSSGVVMVLALGVEHALPELTADEKRLALLPLDHPDRIEAGFYVECPFCGTPNEFGEKYCSGCHVYLPDNKVKRAHTG